MTGDERFISVRKENRLVSKAVAFAQNTREEVRMLGDVAGCVSSEPGTHQTTYICINKKRKH